MTFPAHQPPPIQRQCLLLALLLALPACALAQLSASAGVVSDYRFRGLSLSEGRPVPQLSLAYDHRDGWYAGAFVSGSRLDSVGTSVQLLTYAGYARQLRPGLSWEAGLSNAAYSRAGTYNYGELFFGLAADNLSARMSYSRNFNSLYTEINGSRPLGAGVNLVGHLGVMHDANNSTFQPNHDYRADLRVGLGWKADAWKFQLAFIATQNKQALYLKDHGGPTRTLTLGAGYDF